MKKIKLVPMPKHTDYFWGPMSEIAGGELVMLEKSSKGDCLCLKPNKGLVDVDHRDIENTIDDGKTIPCCLFCGAVLEEGGEHDCFGSPAGLKVEEGNDK